MPSSNHLLQVHLQEDRIAHTYLFSGPEDSAKAEMILGFAKSLNCEKRRFFEACSCPSCRKIENRTHPDVQWFEPDKKTGSIKIEEVRSKLYQASLKPYEGKWKVFILEHAENLTLDAANALLKTLEEPPEHSVFILLVESKSHVLGTIQSRSFEIRVAPSPERNPKQDPQIQLLEERGWDAFFGELRSASRPELQAALETFLLYLRDRSVSEWEKYPSRSKKYLEAIDSVYETQKALDANANQKLTLTHLEIQLENILRDA